MLTNRYGLKSDATKVSEFQDWCLKPLGHPSKIGFQYTEFVGKSSTKPAFPAWRDGVARTANVWRIA
jgi:hypothetical protein